MICSLSITDFALIRNVSLDFSQGLNVLTGETGSGKSFIIGSLDFLLGDKTSGSMVRPGAEKAIAEALFIDNAGERHCLRRELSSNGRSLFRYDGKSITAAAVRNLRAALMLHASQHEVSRLLQRSFLADLIDERLPDSSIPNTKKNLQHQIEDIDYAIANLNDRIGRIRDQQDYLKSVLKEIGEVAPKLQEELELEEARKAIREEESKLRRNAELRRILSGDENTPGLLHRVRELDRVLERCLAQDSDLQEYVTETSAYRALLEDLEEKLLPSASSISHLDRESVESRLFRLSQLKRKFHKTIPEILEMKERIERELSLLDSGRLDLKHLKKQREEKVAELNDVIVCLNRQRHEQAVLLCEEVKNILIRLGFSDHLEISCVMQQKGSGIADREETPVFLWAPNPGQKPGELSQIASGGELSRFLLALLSLKAENSALLVLDEIDAGIGGMTLNNVADYLEEMAQRRQILIVTHWERLAARAKAHFCVEKIIGEESTETHCRRVDGSARENELARMAGRIQ